MAKKSKKNSRGGSFAFRRILVLLVVLGLGALAIRALLTTLPSIVDSNAEASAQVDEPSEQPSADNAEDSSEEPSAPSESEPEAEDSSSQSEESEEEESSESEPESAAEITPEPIYTQPESGEWSLLLVNPTNPLPENFSVQLEQVTDGYQVDARIADSLRRMFNHAKGDGINLMICSAYRAPEYQEGLFQAKKQEYLNAGWGEEEAIAATATIIAKPGTSEHHTGLALDIVTPSYQSLNDGFADTPAFGWLSEHAAEYGFILRYPSDKQDITQIIYEPWHYRYVGVDVAQEIKASGYCLEEYLAVRTKQEAERLAAEVDATLPGEEGGEPVENAENAAE